QKYDPDGLSVWLRLGSNAAQSSDIVTDVDGNSYVVGSFRNTVSFGAFNLSSTSADVNDMFLVKYNAAGTAIWARGGGGVDNDYASGVDVDAQGNIYVTGGFQHSAFFSGINISNFNSGIADVFVAKYNPDGNIQWVNQAGNTYEDAPAKIGVDQQGNSYVGGKFGYEIDFGSNA